jgi:hypothetical protein
MSIVQQISKISSNVEVATRAGEFVRYAKNLLEAKGRLTYAREIAARNGSSYRICDILQKAAEAGTTTSDTWASALAPYQQLSAGFISSLAAYSCFDSISASGAFVAMPMMTRVVSVTAAAMGSGVAEAATKAPSQIEVESTQLSPRKAVALVVVSDELIRSTSTAAFNLIGAELRHAVAKATDALFIGEIALATGAQAINSSGMSSAQFTTDLNDALQLLSIGKNSRVFLIGPPNVIKQVALMRGSGGAVSFPQMEISGGAISGISVLVSDALSDSLVLLDAQSVAADSTMPIVVEVGREASVDLNGGEQPTFNVWQKNCQSLRAERNFAFSLLRANGVVRIDGIGTA